jgi:hypothetical protein
VTTASSSDCFPVVTVLCTCRELRIHVLLAVRIKRQLVFL